MLVLGVAEEPTGQTVTLVTICVRKLVLGVVKEPANETVAHIPKLYP